MYRTLRSVPASDWTRIVSDSAHVPDAGLAPLADHRKREQAPQVVLGLLDHQGPDARFQGLVVGVGVDPVRSHAGQEAHHQVAPLPRLDDGARLRPGVVGGHHDLEEVPAEHLDRPHQGGDVGRVALGVGEGHDGLSGSDPAQFHVVLEHRYQLRSGGGRGGDSTQLPLLLCARVCIVPAQPLAPSSSEPAGQPVEPTCRRA